MGDGSRQSAGPATLAAYAALTRLAFQRQFAYRTANLAGLATNAFFGALRAALVMALFQARGDQPTAGYTLQDAVTYTGLTQAIIAYIAIWGWWDLIKSIRSGEVAADLSRPVDYFGYWCAQDLGRAAAQFLWRALPLVAVYALVYPIRWPPSLAHWLALPAALLLGLLVSFAWRFLVSLAAFWTQDAIGLGRAAWAFNIFLSGFILPNAFLPDWLRALANATFFPAIVNTPIEVYLGLLTGPALVGALAGQLAWFLALYAAGRIVLAAGIRRLVIQGG